MQGTDRNLFVVTHCGGEHEHEHSFVHSCHALKHAYIGGRFVAYVALARMWIKAKGYINPETESERIRLFSIIVCRGRAPTFYAMYTHAQKHIQTLRNMPDALRAQAYTRSRARFYVMEEVEPIRVRQTFLVSATI